MRGNSTFKCRVWVTIQGGFYLKVLSTRLRVEIHPLPLESSITDFWTLSVSNNFEKCPGPEPKSMTVPNFLLISLTGGIQHGTGTSIGKFVGRTYHESFQHPFSNLISNIIYCPASSPTFPTRSIISLDHFRTSIKDLVGTDSV